MSHALSKAEATYCHFQTKKIKVIYLYPTLIKSFWKLRYCLETHVTSMIQNTEKV